jgi:hemoglobin
MPDTRRGMNISAAEYLAAMPDIMNTLEAHDVEESAQKDLLAIAWSLKGEIMHL